MVRVPAPVSKKIKKNCIGPAKTPGTLKLFGKAPEVTFLLPPDEEAPRI